MFKNVDRFDDENKDFEAYLIYPIPTTAKEIRDGKVTWKNR
jgi:hypothetical protein